MLFNCHINIILHMILLSLRINGVLKNLSNTNDVKFSFANDSIKLNVFNPKNNTKVDDVLVIIMAFQYKSGQLLPLLIFSRNLCESSIVMHINAPTHNTCKIN